MSTDQLKASPCGHLVPTIEGQLAFVPDPPPSHIDLTPSLVSQLEKALLAVGTLAGVGETLPNPNLLIVPFLHREAVLSSRIEGTQASISDLFMFEASGERGRVSDAKEVVNYVHALNLGLDLLNELPICLRLVNSIHARLLQDVRGEDKTPGDLRKDQNWIAPWGTPIQQARFIPPPAQLLHELMSHWEQFANDEFEMPLLIQSAVMHYHFEAIHPYLDGNGRIGRLLITLFLCAKGVLPKPLLYLSAYFERHRDEYYDRLYDISATGNWQAWIAFFLGGVAEQAEDALARSRRVRELHERHRNTLQAGRASGNVLHLLDELFVNPYVSAPRASRLLGISHTGAQHVLERLLQAGIIEYAGGRWPRLYVARELLDVIEAPIA